MRMMNKVVTVIGIVFLAGIADTSTGVGKRMPPYRASKEKLTSKGKEVYEGRRILFDEDSYPRKPGRLVQCPRVKREGKNVRITFALDKPDDVLVRIVDGQGKTVRNLACGVLGWNAPGTFKKDSLKQEIVWDSKDVDGKPAPAGCKVHVGVGLTPRFERFVAYDPEQLLKYVSGLEVDKKGRVYVSFVPETYSEPEIIRFDREGRYIETVNPPNPNHLDGKLEDVYPQCNYVDGVAVPAYRGFRPFFWNYGYPLTRVLDTDASFGGAGFHPIRIDRAGNIRIACITRNYYSRRLPEQPPRIYTVKRKDPFWFLKPLWTKSVVWAVDGEGFAYHRKLTKRVRDNYVAPVIYKIEIAANKPTLDFEYCGAEKLPEKRDYLGTKNETGDDEKHFAVVRDIAVDIAGNIFVADVASVKVYGKNGRFLRAFDNFMLGEKQQKLGAPFGLRVDGNVLYVVAKLGEAKKRRRWLPLWEKAHLVKFSLGADAEPTAVWRHELDGEAMLVAVDSSVKPSIVWVGNGGGAATFTRIVDEGKKPGDVRHIGGVKKNALMYPWAIALDGKGRIFVQDYERGVLVRTNDDGTEWLETRASLVYSLFIDRKRGHLYQIGWGTCRRFDLDMKRLKWKDVRGANLGGVDAQGNIYIACGAKKGAEWKGACVAQIDPEGNLKKHNYCEVFAVLGALAVDSQGCIYVMDTCETGLGRKGAPGFMHFHNMGRGGGAASSLYFKRGKKGYWSQSDVCYVVKFGSNGGRRGSEAELWAHSGASPVMYHCNCRTRTNNVTVDDADRIFATDTTKYHVKVLDTAGNLIARVGTWGSHDCRGPKSKYPKPEIAFLWPYSLDVFEDALYVSDKGLRRIVKVRMDYREVKEVAVP